MAKVTSLQAKVGLLLVYSHSFPTVSRNILREVCVYLGVRRLLPCLFDTTLRLYDLDTKTCTAVTLPQSFDTRWVYCNIEDKYLLGVAGGIALAISLNSFEIHSVGKLNIKRSWPGMGWASPYVYIFGGDTYSAPTSCEKLQWGTKEWRPLGDMNGPKRKFTPCRVQNEFYLCCLTATGNPFEAFHLITETFRDLPVDYSYLRNGSVTCLVKDILYVITDQETLQWRLDNMLLEESWRHVNLKGKKSGISNIPPMCVGRKICWVCSYGYLVSLDLHTELIKVKKWSAKQIR